MQYLSDAVRTTFKANFESGRVFSLNTQAEVGWLGGDGYYYVSVPNSSASPTSPVSSTSPTSSGSTPLKRARIIFYLAYNRWPKRIDHINGCEDDDRLCNLREVDASGQASNRGSNTNGLPVGVQVSGENFKSTLYCNGRSYHLGTFTTVAEASDAYDISLARFEKGILPSSSAKTKMRKYVEASQNPENIDPQILERIRHVFFLYPKISPSMLQISLNLPAAQWRPVLEYLIGICEIRRDTLIKVTPSGRSQTYTILEVTGRPE